MPRVHFVLALTIGSAAVIAGCGEDATTKGADASVALDGGFSCGIPGQACTNGVGCCTGACDTGSHTCAVTGGACKPAGGSCVQSTECCNAVCTNKLCGAAVCKTTGDACAAASECCTNLCSTTCQTIAPGGCVTVGNVCAADGDCCSGNCQGLRCASSGAACASQGDLCYQASDCCSNQCALAAGQTVGTCTVLMSMGSGGCQIDGQACTGGDNCCSRLCVETNTGGHVCQVAAGCRVVGDICHQDTDCCNPSAGSCVIAKGSNPPTGTCHAGQGCDPAGGVCGGVGDGSVNARQDCCDCASPKFKCCKPDSNGVHRCYGTPPMGNCPTGYTGLPGCCIPAGDVCTFSSECCGGTPCIPDVNGIRHCLMESPDGGVTCVPLGGVCSGSGDCCAGLGCDIPPGAPAGICAVPPPPTGTDGGAPICATGGQACTSQSDCCVGLTCNGPGGTGTPCAAGQSGCTCYLFVM